MTIPSTFTLFSHQIRVEEDPIIVSNDDSSGLASYVSNVIKLAGPSQTYPRTRNQIEETFLHELVHFILYYMSEKDLRTNERFVDLFANLLHQALSTQSGELFPGLYDPSKTTPDK